MSKPDRKKLLDDAADIFLKLREHPNDPSMQAARDEFVGRGPAEMAAYTQIQQMWTVSGARKKRSTSGPIVMVFLACLLAWQLYQPLRVMLLADHRTGGAPEQIELTSGDKAHLDAATALAEGIDTASRTITLLEGAAFFDVRKDPRPFTVVIGDVTATALGTAFETAFSDSETIVTVFEGRVEVQTRNESWTLTAGERLALTPDADAQRRSIELHTIAGWRTGKLVADGLTVKQVAAVIDRRLPGGITIMNEGLANARVSGTFDLGDPLLALRALAATHDAKVLAVPPIHTVLRAK
ncbi:MAG: FecR domain-containing protein [Pseudomonadota bacterium]